MENYQVTALEAIILGDLELARTLLKKHGQIDFSQLKNMRPSPVQKYLKESSPFKGRVPLFSYGWNPLLIAIAFNR